MRNILFVFSLILGLSSANSFAGDKPLSQRQDLRQYLDQVSQTYHFDRQKLTTLFNQVHLRPKIIDTISHPYESKSWDEYRNAFVTPKRIRNGVAYYHQHQSLIEKIASQYQIPGNVLVAFLGIESNYGRYQAQYPALDALVTLGFDYPKRSKFFRSELTQLLLLAREQHFDPLKLQGSYAGALGMPQFMPSSYRNYAVDWDNHQHADLFHNPADAMASIANYLKHFGWQTGAKIAIPTTTDKHANHNLIWRDLVKSQPIAVGQLARYHVYPAHKLSGKARVIGLVDKDGTNHYWLGLTNIHPILRYNTSTQYALSVMLLAQGIQSALDAEHQRG